MFRDVEDVEYEDIASVGGDYGPIGAAVEVDDGKAPVPEYDALTLPMPLRIGPARKLMQGIIRWRVVADACLSGPWTTNPACHASELTLSVPCRDLYFDWFPT